LTHRAEGGGLGGNLVVPLLAQPHNYSSWIQNAIYLLSLFSISTSKLNFHVIIINIYST
jgi:hypothetical protein